MDKIKWTISSLDIADAILVSLVSESILILEGPPGRGKTEISREIFNYLNIKLNERINFSNSTTKEDIFSRKIPKRIIHQDSLESKGMFDYSSKNIAIEPEGKALLKILNESKNNNNIYKVRLILDEINLAPDDILDNLYFYLINIKDDDKKYTSLDGKTYTDIGKIAIIATMNSAKL